VCRRSAANPTKCLYNKVEKQGSTGREDQPGREHHDLEYPRRTVLSSLDGPGAPAALPKRVPNPPRAATQIREKVVSAEIACWFRGPVRLTTHSSPPSASACRARNWPDVRTRAKLQAHEVIRGCHVTKADGVEPLAQYIREILQYRGQPQDNTTFVEAQGMGDDEHHEERVEVNPE